MGIGGWVIAVGLYSAYILFLFWIDWKRRGMVALYQPSDIAHTPTAQLALEFLVYLLIFGAVVVLLKLVGGNE